MKIPVRFLLPIFALVLALISQVSTASQYEEQPLLFADISDVSILTFDLGDDPDSQILLTRPQPVCYATNNSFSAVQHPLIIESATRPDARAPPQL